MSIKLNSLLRIESKYLALKQSSRREKQNLVKAKARVKHIEQAQVIVQTLAKQIQQNAHKQIASVVSRCLEAVFDDPYRFKLNFVVKRGKTEARLVFLRGSHEVDPETGAGGGAVDVAAFALRLACILLARPKRRRLVVLDEPFKFLHSAVYRERMRLMLHKLAEEMNVQFIMVTGIDELKTGKVIELD